MQEREARRLATLIAKAFTFTPPIDVWVTSFVDLEHPEHVDHAISRLIRSSPDGKEIGVGAVLAEYRRLVARNVVDVAPGCAACDRTGVEHITESSPVSGLPTCYAVPCSRCRGLAGTLERVQRWNRRTDDEPSPVDGGVYPSPV